ncbi:hypothetical protein [Flavobacterium mesophilum]|uniref:hypothetical protein n=1 Tax=Flavobacterium mesophilum TaxID=3143495 RepID=UPI0031D249B4
MRITDFFKIILNAFVNFFKSKPFNRTNKNFKQNAALLIFLALSILFLSCSFRVSETILYMAMGIGCIYGGISMKKHIRNMETNGIRTKAKIIDFHIIERWSHFRKTRMRGRQKLKFYYPIIVFTDLNGNSITQQMPDANTNPQKINDLIDILYLKKENSYEILSNTKWRKSYLPLIFIIIGIYFLLHGFSSAILLIASSQNI